MLVLVTHQPGFLSWIYLLVLMTVVAKYELSITTFRVSFIWE